jgi:hypothetical protein
MARTVDYWFCQDYSWLDELLELLNQHSVSHCSEPEETSHPDSGHSLLRLCHLKDSDAVYCSCLGRYNNNLHLARLEVPISDYII